jgi:hypothetical protein
MTDRWMPSHEDRKRFGLEDFRGDYEVNFGHMIAQPNPQLDKTWYPWVWIIFADEYGVERFRISPKLARQIAARLIARADMVEEFAALANEVET